MKRFTLDHIIAIVLFIAGLVVGMFAQFVAFNQKEDRLAVNVFTESGFCKTVSREFRYGAEVTEGPLIFSYDRGYVSEVDDPTLRKYREIMEVVTLECKGVVLRVEERDVLTNSTDLSMSTGVSGLGTSTSTATGKPERTYR